MIVIRCDTPSMDAWNDFVQRCPHASLYHRFEWRQINRQSFGHRSVYLAATDEGRIVGILPIVQVKSRLFGNIACSLPFVNYGGPCSESADAEHALLRAADEVCEEWGVDYLEIRSRRHLGDSLPASEHKVSMTVSLDADADVLWKGFKTGHRQDIRRGYKNGYTARFGGVELLEDLFEVLAESWRDLGTPIYRMSYLRAILEAFGRNISLCVVYLNEEPVAGAVNGFHGDTVEGMWLGTRSQHRTRYAGYVLYWELLKYACESGYRTFHLGRSTIDSGGETFKKKWNAEQTQLFWHYLLRGRRELPQLNVNNPKYRLAINAWRHLPVPVTQFIGPFIARSIP